MAIMHLFLKLATLVDVHVKDNRNQLSNVTFNSFTINYLILTFIIN